MFIVVHQIDELWFKLALREMVAVRDLFARPVVPEQALASAVRGIRRMETIVRQLVGHFELMETMTTRDYLAFRDKLTGASGFQSAQMRELEILMGLSEEDRIPLGHEGSYKNALKEADGSESPAYARVKARLADRPSLRDAVLDWVHRTPIQGSTPGHPDDAAHVRAFIDAYLATQQRAVDRALGNALSLAVTDADRKRLADRAGAEAASARAYLVAEDEPEPSRASAARVAARDPRRTDVVRAGVRHFPAAPRADGRAHDRPPHGHRRIRRRRLPGHHGPALPRLPRALGGPHAARPGAGPAASRAPGALRVRSGCLSCSPTARLLIPGLAP
jgi:tryptophan 2,3-dioxygenase